MAKAKAKEKVKSNQGTKFPLTWIVVCAVILVAVILTIALTAKQAPQGNVVQEQEEEQEQQTQDKMIEANALEILELMAKSEAYSGWLYSDAETYLIAARGTTDGARLSTCTGVSECEVQWYGTPVNGAKSMATLTRFNTVDNAKFYYGSMLKTGGNQVATDCYVYSDYSAVCRKHNFVFTIVSEYGSSFSGSIAPALEDFALDIYKEIDYWN